MQRPVYSALKQKNPSADKRLKSAVQFRVSEKSRNMNMMNNSRLQSGTTAHTEYYQTAQTMPTGQSTQRNNDEEIIPMKSIEKLLKQQQEQPKKRIQSAMRPSIKMDTLLQRGISQESIMQSVDSRFQSQRTRVQMSGSQSRLMSSVPTQRMIVTQENMNSSEVQKRSKFDPTVRNQVLNLRIVSIEDSSMRSFLTLITQFRKPFMDSAKQHQISQILDCLQDYLEYALGTQNSQVLIKLLYFSGQVMENLNQTQMAIYFYNQTRLMASYAKGTMDTHKMNALIGLANAAITYEKYDDATRIYKKCLQYAWYNKDLEMENQVYDRLSMCYFYLGNIDKSAFYHDRAISYDYELESSPLRQLSSDTLRIFLQKYFNRNYAETITIQLLNRLSIPLPNDLIYQSRDDLVRLCDQIIMESPIVRKMSVPTSINNISMSKRVFSTMQLDGPKLLQEIMHTSEFDFVVYTPKHSFKSESKCFEHLRNKKIRPKDVYHDPKYKRNPFIIDDLGPISKPDDENPREDTTRYKLPLNQQIEIRLKQKLNLDIESRLQGISNLGYKGYERRKNKILITHKNIEHEKKHKTLDDVKKVQFIDKAYNDLIYSLLI